MRLARVAGHCRVWQSHLLAGRQQTAVRHRPLWWQQPPPAGVRQQAGVPTAPAVRAVAAPQPAAPTAACRRRWWWGLRCATTRTAGCGRWCRRLAPGCSRTSRACRHCWRRPAATTGHAAPAACVRAARLRRPWRYATGRSAPPARSTEAPPRALRLLLAAGPASWGGVTVGPCAAGPGHYSATSAAPRGPYRSPVLALPRPPPPAPVPQAQEAGAGASVGPARCYG